MLYRRDVDPIEELELFDRTTHKAVKVVETDDERSDQRVAQVLKRGFVRSEKQLRPEEVVIMRYRGRKE